MTCCIKCVYICTVKKTAGPAGGTQAVLLNCCPLMYVSVSLADADAANCVLLTASLASDGVQCTVSCADCNASHITLLCCLGVCAGGYSKWLKAGLNTAPSLPKWLQDAGYNTYYVGKFLVEYALYNYRPVPDGEPSICKFNAVTCHAVQQRSSTSAL